MSFKWLQSRRRKSVGMGIQGACLLKMVVAAMA